jgi:small subunit ribosomal protein S21
MIIIKVENSNLEKALKALKRKTFAIKQVQEIRNRSEFVKPSIKKRLVLKKAKYKESILNR